MPRRLLRNGRIVVDEWRYAAEIAGGSRQAGDTGVDVSADGLDSGDGSGASVGASVEGSPAQREGIDGSPADRAGAGGPAADGAGPYGVILTFDEWLADKPRWLAAAVRLGVVLLPAHQVELLAPDLASFELVGAEFPGPSEGRGYTQGRLLRERFSFRGELRATGFVRRDQLFFLARCGFNSFELPDSQLATAAGALSTFSAVYQPSNDAGLAFEPQHR